MIMNIRHESAERQAPFRETVERLCEDAMGKARARQDQLTKPRGGLGRLEALSIQLAGILGEPKPMLRRKLVLVVAADHGVTEEGVSAYPAEVTRQMVRNFLDGGAAINVLARQAGAEVLVVDAGVQGAALPEEPGLVSRRVGPGSANMVQGPAMTQEQAAQSVQIGMELLEAEVSRKKIDALALGEMGIGNTTPAAAVAAAMTGCSAKEAAGPGAGLDDAGVEWKAAVIERALTLHRPNAADPLDVLSKVGGFEIGVLAGAALSAASHRCAVVLDGYPSTAGAMIAVGLEPAVKPYLIAGHRSAEPGHEGMLRWLGLEPLFDLDMRLGEGTGGVLAMHVLETACRTLDEMATFEEAGVTDARG